MGLGVRIGVPEAIEGDLCCKEEQLSSSMRQLVQSLSESLSTAVDPD
jgi:hypothetical protein